MGKEQGAGVRLSSTSSCALTRGDVRIRSGFPCPQGLQVILPQLTNETVVPAARKCSCVWCVNQGRLWHYLQAPEELKSLIPLPWLSGRAGTEQLNQCCSCSVSLVDLKQVWCSKGQGNLFFGDAVKLDLSSSWPGLWL